MGFSDGKTYARMKRESTRECDRLGTLLGTERGVGQLSSDGNHDRSTIERSRAEIEVFRAFIGSRGVKSEIVQWLRGWKSVCESYLFSAIIRLVNVTINQTACMWKKNGKKIFWKIWYDAGTLPKKNKMAVTMGGIVKKKSLKKNDAGGGKCDCSFYDMKGNSERTKQEYW